MNRFAELLDRLAYEPGRNNKLRLITAYLRETPDPDRGYALAAITGALSFKFSGVRLGNIFSVLSNKDVIKLLNSIIAGGYFSTIMEYILTGR